MNDQTPTPVPARHLAAIFEICHLSPAERASFLAAYPRRSQAIEEGPGADDAHVIQIRVPNLGDPRLQRELEETIQHTASRIIALLVRR